MSKKEKINVDQKLLEAIDKIEKKNRLKKFHEFNREVIKEYLHDNDEPNLEFFVEVFNTCGKKYDFFKYIDDEDVDVIAAALYFVIEGEEK